MDNSIAERKQMYTVLHNNYKGEALARIRIDEGAFAGLVYHYNTVSVGDTEHVREGTDVVKFSFDYDVDEYPENYHELDEYELIDLETLLGDILVAIILEKEQNVSRAINNNESDNE